MCAIDSGTTSRSLTNLWRFACSSTEPFKKLAFGAGNDTPHPLFVHLLDRKKVKKKGKLLFIYNKKKALHYILWLVYFNN
jgi:hypothetical protein